MISIIIPLYNKANIIERTIQSVLSQSYKDFEIVVVDDGSTDESKDIVLSIKDSRIKYLYKENGGVSSARNFGLYNAKGEWIMFLDSDDFLCEESLSIYSLIIDKQGFDIIVGNFYKIEGRHKYLYSSYKLKSGIYFKPTKELWLKRIYCRPGNFLVKKEKLQTLDLYDENLSYSEDTDFCIRLISTSIMYYIDKPIMMYIKYAEGASMRIHPWNKDFVSKINKSYIQDIYTKLFIYEYLLFESRYRQTENEHQRIQNIKNNLFGPTFKLVYWYYKLIRTIKRMINKSIFL